MQIMAECERDISFDPSSEHKIFALVYARCVKFRPGEVTIQVRLASGYLHVEGTRTD